MKVCKHAAQFNQIIHEGKRKRKEKTTPFGVNLTKSVVLHQAAQEIVHEGMHSVNDLIPHGEQVPYDGALKAQPNGNPPHIIPYPSLQDHACCCSA